MAITSIPLPPATGTITLTEDSDTVSGTGTGLKSLEVGDLLVTGTSIVVVGEKPTGNDSATLAIPFTGATETDVAYRIVPRSLNSQAAYFFQLLNLNISSQEGQLVWLWSTATEASDPGAAKIQIDNAAWSSATTLYLSDTDKQGNDLGDWLATWEGFKIQVTSLDNPGVFGFATLGTVTDSTGYRTIALTSLIGTPSFSSGERVVIAPMPAGPQGATGDTGATGATGSTGATGATGDPGADSVITGTSATSAEIGTGSKGPFTTQAGIGWVVGTRVRLASDANVANFMEGSISAYSGTDLTVTVDKVGGSGTLDDWNISIAGVPGTAGTDGSDGGGLKGISIRAASTTNVDLSSDLEAGDSAGGVTLATGNAFGAFGQTDETENGIYVVQASGAAARHATFDSWDEIAGGVFPVRQGDFAGAIFQNTDAVGAGTIDTNDLTFVQSGGGSVDVIELPEQVSPPSTATNAGAIYTKESGGQTEAFFREEGDGDEVQLTRGGVVPIHAEADVWRLTTNITSNGDITANLERSDDPSAGIVGSGMSESSGIFSFPSTGIWLVIMSVNIQADGGDYLSLRANVTVNNGSTWDLVARCDGQADTSNSANEFYTTQNLFLVDVTDILQVKVKFDTISIGGDSAIRGTTDINETSFSFFRLGDT